MRRRKASSRPTWTYAVKLKSDLCAGSVGGRRDSGERFLL